MDDFTKDYNAAHATPKHEQSALDARKVLDFYITLSGGSSEPDETTLTDLLTDLRHFAANAVEPVDFEQVTSSSALHFEHETPTGEA